jgi:hypothetical protein
MNLTDSKTRETNQIAANEAIVALRNGVVQGNPLVVEWRLSDENASRSQDDGDVGCGCGPIG